MDSIATVDLARIIMDNGRFGSLANLSANTSAMSASESKAAAQER